MINGYTYVRRLIKQLPRHACVYFFTCKRIMIRSKLINLLANIVLCASRSFWKGAVFDKWKSLPATKDFGPLFEASGTDKFYYHHYEQYYNKWLLPYRDMKGVKLLELGVFRGESMNVWRHYFDNANLILGLAYGVDEQSLQETLREIGDPTIQVIFGDQSNGTVLKSICKKGPFDIIIDDASHIPTLTMISFNHLWKCLKFGGLYIIEDMEVNYFRKYYTQYGHKVVRSGIHNMQNVPEKFKQLVDTLNRRQAGAESIMKIFPGDEFLCQLNFGKNIIGAQKCNMQEMELDKSIARWRQQIDQDELEQIFGTLREAWP